MPTRVYGSGGGGLMELSLATRTVGEHTVLEVGGEVDVYTAPRLRERLLELIDGGARHVVVDLGRVDFLDSTGLGVLVGALKRLRAVERLVRPGLRQGAAAQDLPDHRAGPGVPAVPDGRRGDQPPTRRAPARDGDGQAVVLARAGARAHRPAGRRRGRPAGRGRARSCSTRCAWPSVRRAPARWPCTAQYGLADLVAGGDVRRRLVRGAGGGPGADRGGSSV